MDTARLEAFSDGVLAIIITITVLGLRVPDASTVGALMPLIPELLIYAWSFQTIATYWNNHHHLLHATKEVSGKIMWANMNLLFWLTLVPFTTEWLGVHPGAPWPTAAYCVVLLASGMAYSLLERAILSHQGNKSTLGTALGTRTKERVTLSLYILSVITAFIYPWASYVFVIMVTLLWFFPDRRIARIFS